MTRTLIDYEGFDYLATGDIDDRLGGANSGASDVNIQAGRNSGLALRVGDASSSCFWQFGQTVPAGDRVVFGCAFKFGGTSAWGAISFWDTAGIDHAGLSMDGATGLMTGQRSGSNLAGCVTTLPMVAGTWYYLEFEFVISNTVGEFTLRIDGADQFTVTGLDTQNGSNGNISSVRFTGSGSAREVFIDDAYIRWATISETTKTSYFGDCRAFAAPTDGVGASNQFTPLSSTNESNVDDATPDGDTTYNESSTVGHIDSFTMTDLPSAGTILAVAGISYARKTDAGTRSLGQHYRIGGVNFASADLPLGTTYRFAQDIKELSPATGLAWTDTEINGMEAGYKVNA